MVVGLDIGYGYTKVATSDGKLFMFKTVISQYIPQKIWGKNGDPVIVNSMEYLIGDSVEDNVNGNFSVSEDFVATNEYYAIIAKVLDMIGNNVELLVLGLPPGLYTEQRTSELVRKFRLITMKNKLGHSIEHPESIMYIPQGSGIYFSHVLGGNIEDLNLNVAVIDIGYYTLDAVCFSAGKFVNGAARSYPSGSKFLIEKVKEAFSRHYGIFINDNLGEALLKDGKILHFGQEYSFDANVIVKQYYQDQVMKAIKDYATALRQYGKVVDKVIIGGGSVVWAPPIRGAQIVTDPQMANAIGYMKYGVSKLEKMKQLA